MSDSSGQFLFSSAANGEVFFWSLDSKNKDLRKQRELLVFQGSPSGDSEPDSVASLSWNDDSILKLSLSVAMLTACWFSLTYTLSQTLL